MSVSLDDGTAIAAAARDRLPSAGVARSASGFLQVIRPRPPDLWELRGGRECGGHKKHLFDLDARAGPRLPPSAPPARPPARSPAAGRLLSEVALPRHAKWILHRAKWINSIARGGRFARRRERPTSPRETQNKHKPFGTKFLPFLIISLPPRANMPLRGPLRRYFCRAVEGGGRPCNTCDSVVSRSVSTNTCSSRHVVALHCVRSPYTSSSYLIRKVFRGTRESVESFVIARNEM